MTLRIDTTADGQTATLRLVGRVDAEYLPELRKQLSRHRPRLVLDLDEVTLVDAAVVRFLAECEEGGIELSNCPPYVRAWMNRERNGNR